MTNVISPDFWTAYILPSGVALAVFYLLYKTLVRNDANLNSRRFVMVGFVMFAMVLPFLNFEIPVNVATSEQVAVLVQPAILLNPVAISEAETISIFPILGWIYLIGVLFFAGRAIVGILRLTAFSRDGDQKGNLILCKNIPTAFSFFNRIFIPETWYNGDEREVVLRHEQIHVQQKHSWDLMLMELVCIIQFFNPFVWLLKREMRLNHEFLADRGALENGGNQHQYFEILLQKIIGKQPILVHSFNYSPIKKRIMMQLSKPAKMLNQARYLAFVPLALALTFLFACQEKPATSEVEVSNSNAESVVLRESSIIVDGEEIGGNSSERPMIIVDGEEFTGNLDDLNTDNIESVTILKDSSAIKQYGPNVKNGVIIVSMKSPDDVFTIVEEMPQYPGGENARNKYLMENLSYPAKAREKGVKGMVAVTFVVEKDGTISNVKVAKGIGDGCDEEAVRVVKNMPKWTPGKQRNKTVRVQFTLPIMFALNG
ncbi:MAG: TonB family protein [Bacteroidales bacterium]|jgi:TonB family protein|nr:TonB family protein [Bacteroidales bacterium]